jgi:membrane fusion protein, multidrug efflux system
LHDKGFIAKAALERALAVQQAAQSQVKSLQAQASAVRTQAGFFTVRAPYAGVVSQLNVELGDMAMPGRPLLTVYDPSDLRVSASVPSAVATQPDNLTGALLEVPALGTAGRNLAPTRVQVLPTVDAQSLTQTVRLNTPKAAGLAPGQFARVWLKGGAPASTLALGGTRVFIPGQAIVRRAEMTGVYVLSAAGKPLLRQVRLGRQEGDQVEVLSGLDEGDKLVLNPSLAARLTRAQ